MNKLFTSIAVASLSLTMAVGVGVAVGQSAKTAEKVNASTLTDVITAADLAATNTTYTDFSGVSITSDAVYAGNSAKDGSGNIQMRSKNSNSGIVSTTSGGTVKSVAISVGSGTNTIDVYGSHSAYSSASDLYGSSSGTLIGSVSATGTVTFSSDYEYVGIRSNNGAIYLGQIEIAWESGTPVGDSVSITGLPATSTGYVNRTLDLGSLITVSATGSYSTDVTWESGDDDIATVDQNGIVTGVGEGTVSITVTADDDNTVYQTCSVTIGPEPTYYTITFGSDDNDGSELKSDAEIRAVSGYSVPSEVTFSDIAKVYGGTGYGLKLGTGSVKGEISVSISDSLYITNIVISAKAYGSDSTSISVNSGTAQALTSSKESYTFDISASKTNKAHFSPVNASKNRYYIYGITINFASAGSRSLIGLEITTPTTDLVFTNGQALTATGLVATATFDSEPISVELSTLDLTFNPALGSVLSTNGTITITVSYTHGSVTESDTYTITVNAYVTSTYYKVTDTSHLRAGDEIIIVADDVDKAISTTQNSNNRGEVEITKNGNAVTDAYGVQKLTLVEGTSSGTFGFYTGAGYLYAAGSKTDKANNYYLRTKDTLDANGSFLITISEGITTIAAQGSNTNNLLKHNATSNLFSCYASDTSSSTAKDVSIYKLPYSAVDFAKYFVDGGVCDLSGSTGPTQTKWADLALYFSDVSSDGKATLASSSTPSSEVKNPSTDEEYISEALYLYDYAVGKYNTASSKVYTEFITGRTVSYRNLTNTIFGMNSEATTAIIVVVALISVTAIGAIFFIKRRKYN